MFTATKSIFSTLRNDSAISAQLEPSGLGGASCIFPRGCVGSSIMYLWIGNIPFGDASPCMEP